MKILFHFKIITMDKSRVLTYGYECHCLPNDTFDKRKMQKSFNLEVLIYFQEFRKNFNFLADSEDNIHTMDSG
ncbi:unnamed protein product, partial [Nesidiocoris tenuis]